MRRIEAALKTLYFPLLANSPFILSTFRFTLASVLIVCLLVDSQLFLLQRYG